MKTGKEANIRTIGVLWGFRTKDELIENGAWKIVKNPLISVGQFAETFEEIISKGEEVLFVGLSSGVSGTINSATLAKQQICQERPESKIEIIDSLAAGMGEGMLAIEASKLVSNTKNTLEAIRDELLKLRGKICQYFTVDDLKYLKRTGRISSTAAFVGNALKIKPILTGSEDGHIILIDKAIGVNNAYKQLANKFGGEMASEGLEEALQEVISPMLKNAIFNTEDKVDWEQVAYSGLLGALSAGMFNSADAVTNTIRENNKYRSVYGTSAEDLIASGMESAEGTKSRQLAEQFAKELAGGKQLSGKQLKQLVSANDEAIKVENAQNALPTNVSEAGILFVDWSKNWNNYSLD